MNDRWRKLNDTMHQYVPLRASMCQHVPACANIAVFQLCRERQPLVEQSWWAWTENAWINAMVFVPMAQSPPKAGSKELLYKFDRWVYILGFAEGDLCRFACKSLPTESGLCRSVFFCGCRSNGQVLPKASPWAIFNWKNLISRTW